MSNDPVREAILQGPARDLVAGVDRAGAALALPTGAALLTPQPNVPRTLVLGVVTTPPQAMAPLFAAARRGTFEGEAVAWASGDISRSLAPAYMYLDVHTKVAGLRHVMVLFEPLHLWREYLFDDPPEHLLLGDGDDDRMTRLFQGQAPADTLRSLDLVFVPNPPLPYGLRIG